MTTATTEIKEAELNAAVQAAPAESRSAEVPVNKAAMSRRAFRAAEDSAEFFDHLRAHYRETRRTATEMPCAVKLVMADGSVFDTGSATVRNVSPSGALIAGIQTLKSAFPVKPFKVHLLLTGGEYEGIRIEATPVRFVSECAGVGVKFDEITVAV